MALHGPPFLPLHSTACPIPLRSGAFERWGYVLFNTMRGFLKDKNMRANPRVSFLVYDSTNPLHYIEIEGVVIEMTETGAVEHNDLLTRLYTGNPAARFFGDAVSAE